MLLTAQRTYFQTNLAYLDARRDLRAATTSLEGNLLSDSLQSADPKPALQVVFQASAEIGNSIIFSTLIIVLVFIPLFALCRTSTKPAYPTHGELFSTFSKLSASGS